MNECETSQDGPIYKVRNGELHPAFLADCGPRGKMPPAKIDDGSNNPYQKENGVEYLTVETKTKFCS